MKVIVLGCGPSTGIPLITGGWGSCNPNNPRNRRRRSSVLIQNKGKNLLIDAGPDLREQMLSAKISHIDAVIITHAHADHLRGLDDLKFFAINQHQPIPVYGDLQTVASIEKGYSYAVQEKEKLYPPFLTLHILETERVEIEGISVQIFKQNHGRIHSLGLRIGPFAYSTDFNTLDAKALNCLEGVKCWIVDCLRFLPHLTHSFYYNTLHYIQLLKPTWAFLTHMNEDIDYEAVCHILPLGVKPAYDGLIVEFCGEDVLFHDNVDT